MAEGMTQIEAIADAVMMSEDGDVVHLFGAIEAGLPEGVAATNCLRGGGGRVVVHVAVVSLGNDEFECRDCGHTTRAI